MRTRVDARVLGTCSKSGFEAHGGSLPRLSLQRQQLRRERVASDAVSSLQSDLLHLRMLRPRPPVLLGGLLVRGADGECAPGEAPSPGE